MSGLDRWVDISRIYHDALQQDSGSRDLFLDKECHGDTSLRREVQSLLDCHTDAATFMAAPAMAVGTTAVADAALVGRRLGSYTVEALLGAGGMGQVYRATDVRLGRAVALKILPSHLRRNPVLRERFLREARVVAALRHPHICVLYDIGQESDIDFLVMEHLEGATLADRLAGGALPRAEVFRHAGEILEALEETHRQGLVHGDLKPSNVMLTSTGAKLLDFGISRPVAGSDSTIAGTIPYMAPEQLAGTAIDIRTDIFAFGAILFEMLTGRRAFTSAARENYAASIRIAGVPAALNAVIARCLAPDRDNRYATAAAVAADLQRVSSARVGPRRAAGLLAIAGLIVVSGIALWQGPPPQGEALPNVAQRTADVLLAPAAPIAPPAAASEAADGEPDDAATEASPAALSTARVNGDEREKAILMVLSRYADAYRQGSVDALKAIYPALPAAEELGLRRLFRDCRESAVHLAGVRVTWPEDAGTASVQARATYTCTPRTGQAAQTVDTDHLFLMRDRRDGRWIIERMATVQPNR